MTRDFEKMTDEELIIGQENFITRFSQVFERLIVKMHEVDDWCVEATKDITKQELSLIGFIGDNGDVIMRDVANFLEVPFSTATGIVEKLVLKGYLKRYNSEEDRRTVLVCLTSRKGRHVFKLFSSKKREMSERIMNILNTSEQEGIIKIFEKISNGI